MWVSLLFTGWIIVATVSSDEANESTETSTENHDSSSDEKSSNESNEVKDTSDENDSSSTEKDSSAEDDGSAEKDSSSTEQNSSEERENKNSNESSEEGHGRSYVKKKDDKYTKTTVNTFKPGSSLPPCAICNFQAGGVFIPWSIPCAGCRYRAPSCSSMGFCCVMSPSCAKIQQGKPCPVNSHLGHPMQSMTSIVSNNQLNPLMVQSNPYVRSMGPLIPGTIQQMPRGMNTIDITTTQIFQGPNGKYGGNVPGIRTTGTSALYGAPTNNGLIPNNMLNNPVYQAIGVRTGGNVWGRGSMINPTCPSTKAACATLGGTCIPSTQFCGGVHKQDEQLCGSNCKCCIKPKNKECYDRNKSCLPWASAGYCSTYPHIKADCKVSCSICKPNPGEGTPPAPSLALSTHISNQCPDKIPNCKSVATSTACATYAKMKELCPTTCGVTCTKSQTPAHPKGGAGVCSHLTRNTCSDVLNGHCIPLGESCGGWFKEDPTLCGNGNCKCCITERCNVAPEDAAVCSHLGGKCIPATTKCRGSSYPLCGLNTCQCCVDNPSAYGSCPENQRCGNQGTCTLGGCHEGYELTEGQCQGPECYCCKKVKGTQRALSGPMESTYGTCSDKQCGDGGTCRDTTCLPGEVRLRENCGKGNCVCCKLAQNFDSPEESCAAKPCGSGGKCRCTSCEENEERINGHCQNLDCICCKTKIEGKTKSYTRLNNPTPIMANSYQYSVDAQYPVDVLKSLLQTKGEFSQPVSRKIPRPSQPTNYGNGYSSFPNSFRNDMPPPECRPSRNNLCKKKGGNCIPLYHRCNGKSIVKYCGKSKTCQCCVPDAPYTALPLYGNSGKLEAYERSFSPSDQSVEPDEHFKESFVDLANKENAGPLNSTPVSIRDGKIEFIQDVEKEDYDDLMEEEAQSRVNVGPVIPPPVSITDEKIESIQNTQKDYNDLMEEEAQSRVELNIESLSEDKNLNQTIDNEQPTVVADAQSVLDYMKSMAVQSDSSIEKVISDITTAASLVSDISDETSITLDNNSEKSVVNIPSLTFNTPMDLESLVKTPVIKDPMESNYEMNILPELGMIDYYESIDTPLDETENGLYSDKYYEMSDIKSNDDKSIQDDNDALNDNTATYINTLQNASYDLDNLNDKFSKNLYPSLDVNENSNEASDVDSDPANSFMNLEDYYENNDNINIMDYYDQVEKGNIVPTINDDEQVEKYSNIDIMDYYDQVEETQPMDSGVYQSNYGNMYPSIDDGYYLADYPYINQYDDQY